MKIVFISGKYTAKTQREIRENIELARKAALLCARNRIGFFCPHTMTAEFDRLAPRVPYGWYINLCAEYITQLCSAALMLPKWNESPGARYEHELFIAEKKPIFYITHDEPLELPQGLMGWYSRSRV